ncbi:MAG: DUF4168 domain-containing protein [Pseudolabrys sp.]|jgi:hypothetical protein
MQASTRLSILVFATSWLAFAPTVNAQNQSEPSGSSPTTPGPSSPSASIPDNKLDAAAAAMKSVSMVKEDYGQRIAQAPDDSEKSRLANEGGQALTKAVTDQGLSVEEYDEILRMAQYNPAVREKILKRIKN